MIPVLHGHLVSETDTHGFELGTAGTPDLFLRIRPTPTTVAQGDCLTYAFPLWNLGPNNVDHPSPPYRRLPSGFPSIAADLLTTSRLPCVRSGSGVGLASMLTGVQSFGIEVKAAYVASAQECAQRLRQNRVRFIPEDARTADLSVGQCSI